MKAWCDNCGRKIVQLPGGRWTHEVQAGLSYNYHITCYLLDSDPRRAEGAVMFATYIRPLDVAELSAHLIELGAMDAMIGELQDD